LTATGLVNSVVRAAAIDPSNPMTLYAAVNAQGSARLFKSTDGGDTWKPTGLNGITVNVLTIHPVDSTTLYAGTGDNGEGGALLKSTDGGETWSIAGLSSRTILGIAIDRRDPSVVYSAAAQDVDAFMQKYGPSGAILYSTYLGGAGRDRAADIGVDAAGNAYITGGTFSDRFPIRDAVVAVKPSGPAATSVFVTKLSTRINALLSPLGYSTYLGSDETSRGVAIAVDGAGKAYVTGTTGPPSVAISASIKSVHGEDVFVAKLVAPPLILGASVRGKKLFVAGEGFDAGAVLLLNGEPQKTRNDASTSNLLIIAPKAGKKTRPGESVSLQVRNSDGTLSDVLLFARPAL